MWCKNLERFVFLLRKARKLMLQAKQNPNKLNFETIFKDRKSIIKYLRILRWQYKSFDQGLLEAKALLTYYNYSEEEQQELLDEANFNKNSKVVDLTQKIKHDKHYRKIQKHVEFLHNHEALDSFVTVAHIDYSLAQDGWHQFHYKASQLTDVLALLRLKKTSTYMSVNEFFSPQRTVLSLRYLTAFYVDIDAHDENYNFDLKATKKFLEKKYKEGVLPRHSKLSFTGRGVQIYWKIELSPASNLWLWQIVQNFIIEALMDIKDHIEGHSVDIHCSDCTRVFRVDDTFNPLAGVYSRDIETNDNVYRMNEFLNDYFKDKYTVRKRKKTATESQGEVQVGEKVIVLNDRSEMRMRILRQRRCQDLKKLLELRKNQLQKGHREYFLFVYGWTAIENLKSLNWIYQELSNVNQMFADPLEDKEVLKQAKKIHRKYTKDTLKQTAKKGTLSQVINRYTFRNTTIIKNLEITELERQHFITILYKDEAKIVYNKRRNEMKRKKRLDENGLNKRQRKELELSLAKAEIYRPYIEQGWGAKKIAKALGKSDNTVKYDLKTLRAKGLL